MARTLIVPNVTDTTFWRMVKKKEEDGFKDKDWSEYFDFLFRNVSLKTSVDDIINRTTKEGLLEIWVQNFADNLEYIRKGKNISHLVPEEPDKAPKGYAIVIGRGPSVFKLKHLEMLAESNYNNIIIATDGMLYECLKRGIVPNYVLSVDGNRKLIVRWYGDPDFDEHFPDATEEEKRRNQECIELVNAYGKKIKALLITSVAHNVYERCVEAGIDIYWFSPIFDDYRQNESFTKLQKIMTKSEVNPNGVPAMVTGGNAGACSWVFAHTILRRIPVLIGIDYGYPEGTPLRETCYYDGMKKGIGDIEKIKEAYKTVYNPFFKVNVLADMVFEHYKKAFLDMCLNTSSWIYTIQCSPGFLFSENPLHKIKCMNFEDFLKMEGEKNENIVH